jgi:hypothetical protein
MKQRFSGFGERIAQGFAVIKEQAFIYKKTS